MSVSLRIVDCCKRDFVCVFVCFLYLDSNGTIDWKENDFKGLNECLLLCCLYVWRIDRLQYQQELDGNHVLIIFDFFVFH